MWQMGLDSELIVAGAILGDSRTLRVIRAELSADDFRTELGRVVFIAACSLEDDGKPVDPVTIKAEAASNGTALTIQDLSSAMELSAVSDLDVHIQGMKNDMLRSGLMEAVSSAYLRLGREEPPQIVCADLQGAIQQAVERDHSHTLASSADAMSEFMDRRIAIDDGTAKAVVSTGYNSLDNALGGGLVDGGLYILGARPGCGKSTLGLSIAEKVAAAGTPVLFISLEMPVVQLTARRLAAETGVSTTRILLHSLSDAENQMIADAMDKLHARQLFFNQERRATVSSIGVQARQVKHCGLVVVDYLGLIQHSPGKSLYERVTETSNSLKRLALSLNIPILCLAQLNRELEGRKGPPRLSDLRDSGAIEQDADGVLLLHRPQYEDKNGPTPLVVSVAKNRHGPAGSELLFNWYLNNGRIRPTAHERLKYA